MSELFWLITVGAVVFLFSIGGNVVLWFTGVVVFWFNVDGAMVVFWITMVGVDVIVVYRVVLWVLLLLDILFILVGGVN